jgi:hypothetical protein
LESVTPKPISEEQRNKLRPSDYRLLDELIKIEVDGKVRIPPKTRNELANKASISASNISKSFNRLKYNAHIEGEKGIYKILTRI